MRDERGQSFSVNERIPLEEGDERDLPKPFGARARVLLLYALAVAVFFSPMLVVSFEVFASVWIVVYSITSLFLMVFIARVGIRIASQETLAVRARTMRHGSQCPQCWYDLVGLEPEADGCTVCPECGTAWRLGSGRGN